MRPSGYRLLSLHPRCDRRLNAGTSERETSSPPGKMCRYTTRHHTECDHVGWERWWKCANAGRCTSVREDPPDAPRAPPIRGMCQMCEMHMRQDPEQRHQRSSSEHARRLRGYRSVNEERYSPYRGRFRVDDDRRSPSPRYASPHSEAPPDYRYRRSPSPGFHPAEGMQPAHFPETHWHRYQEDTRRYSPVNDQKRTIDVTVEHQQHVNSVASHQPHYRHRHHHPCACSEPRRVTTQQTQKAYRQVLQHGWVQETSRAPSHAEIPHSKATKQYFEVRRRKRRAVGPGSCCCAVQCC